MQIQPTSTGNTISIDLELLELTDLNILEKVLYAYRQHIINNRGACTINPTVLARRLGVSTKSVYRAIRKLDEHPKTKHQQTKCSKINEVGHFVPL